MFHARIDLMECRWKNRKNSPTLATELVEDHSASTSARVDKWLWAARMYKSRSLSSSACTSGHVKIAGQSVKPSKLVHIGDRIEALTPGGPRILVVTGISEQRGPATIARTLYEDHSPPPPSKEEMVVNGQRERGSGRPSKRDRRDLDRLRGR